MWGAPLSRANQILIYRYDRSQALVPRFGPFSNESEDKSPTASSKSLEPVSGIWVGRSVEAHPVSGARVAAWLRKKIPEIKRDGRREWLEASRLSPLEFPRTP